MASRAVCLSVMAASPLAGRGGRRRRRQHRRCQYRAKYTTLLTPAAWDEEHKARRRELATGIGPPPRHWGAVHRRSRAGRPEWLTKWQGSKRSVWLGRYSIMKPKLMWSRPPRITGLPEPDAKLVMGARRKGRPPLGSQATSGADRARRYRKRLAQLGKQASER